MDVSCPLRGEACADIRTDCPRPGSLHRADSTTCVTVPSGWYSYEYATEFENPDPGSRDPRDREGRDHEPDPGVRGRGGRTDQGGLLYHFRTREELLLAIQRHLTEGWEKQLEARLGKAFAEATAAERAIAYTLMDVDSEPRKADLAFMVESASDPELAQVWNSLVDRWVPVPSEPDPAQLELFLARMAADGLWLFEATTGTKLTPAVKDALRQRIAALTESASTP